MKNNLFPIIMFLIIMMTVRSFSQDKSVDQIMRIPDTRQQVFNYLIQHKSDLNYFMNKVYNDRDATMMMIDGMIRDPNILNITTEKIFAKASSDSTTFLKMYKIMKRDQNLMNMLESAIKSDTNRKKNIIEKEDKKEQK